MSQSKITSFLAIVPAALMLAGHWDRTAAATTARAQSQTNRYADGVYTARGQYGGGPSFLVVTVTLNSGIITAVNVEPQATVPQSLEFQRSFAAAVPSVVVGRPIDQVRVSKLAGSSGTPDGFNDAIQQIRQQAIR